MTTSNTTKKTTKQTAQFNAVIEALQNRANKDCTLAAKAMTVHVVATMNECGIKPDVFVASINAVKGSPEFVAQKSIRRACYTLQALASNLASLLPVEVFVEVQNLPKLGKVSNELNRALLSRFVEFDENSENSASLTNAHIKHTDRLRKSVSTASAQSSSLKGMLRMFGVVTAAKHSRDFELDTSAVIVQRLQSLISQ